MAKEIEKETEEILSEEKKKLSKEEKKALKEQKKEEKLAAKREKAEEKKKEIVSQVRELKAQIAEETDEKKKNKLRRRRDNLIAQRDSFIKSKDGMTIPLAPNTKKAIRACIAVVVIIAILFAYVATGTVRHGLLGALGVPQSTFTGMVIKDGDGEKHRIKVSTYNYYFAMVYNNLQSTQSQYEQYGIELEEDKKVDFDKKLSSQTTTNDDGEKVTWAEYIHDEAIESIKSTYLYYYEAVKANNGKEPEITKEQKDELNETLKNYKTTAEGEYGFTVSGYLTAAMGKGVNEKVFRKEATISYISENYKEDYEEELNSKEYSDKEYESYRDKNKNDLVSVDIKLFECDSEDDAKAFAKALKADGSNFAQLASKYSTDKWDKKANKNSVETTYKNITRPDLINMSVAIAAVDEHEHSDNEKEEEHTYSGLDWLFSSKRKAGDIKQQSTSVVYVLKPSRLAKINPVTVRHILIAPFSEKKDDDGKVSETPAEEPTKASDKEWANAKKKAEKILKEYKSGKKTAKAFGELAKENSSDSNASDGGIYKNVTPNQMVPSFNAWIFDAKRKAGDTSIVKTEFGYHIIYFEGRSDLTVWQYTAQQSLASEDSSKVIEKLEKSYSIKENWLGSRYFETDTDIDS